MSSLVILYSCNMTVYSFNYEEVVSSDKYVICLDLVWIYYIKILCYTIVIFEIFMYDGVLICSKNKLIYSLHNLF